MNRILYILTLGSIFTFSSLNAQYIPNGMNYQAVARDAKGEIMANQTISLRLSLLSKQESKNEIIYSEVHQIKTNQQGMFNLIIGEGNVLNGTFEAIPWEGKEIWIQTAVDAGGGNQFAVLNEARLLAVPYALHANTANKLIDEYERITEAVEKSAIPLCPEDDCSCNGGYTQMEVYYFGANGVTVDVYSDQNLTNLIESFSPVNNGDLLEINGFGPDGTLGTYTFFSVTNGADVCTTPIFSTCPRDAWPGAEQDLETVGKTFGNFTVYSHTDEENNNVCTTANIADDWHVGGNVIDPANNRFGTRNDESVVIITNDNARGIITNTGLFGINTTTPTTRLDVAGDVHISQTLDVDGVTTIHNTTPSTGTGDGALVVAGGVGIAENLNVGNNGTIGNDLIVTRNFTVRTGGLSRFNNPLSSLSSASGSVVISGGVGIGENLNIADDLTVESGGITRLLSNVQSGNELDGALIVSGGVGISRNLNVGSGGIVRFRSTLNSFSPVTGAMVVSGGVGIGEDLFIGDDADVADNLEVGGNAGVDGNLTVDGITQSCRVTVTGGCDFAEAFDVNTTEESLVPEPGMLVSIDPENPGELMITTNAYDKKLAGIISGANGVKPGMIMGQDDIDWANGDYPVALTGRVYVKANATFGKIEPGDMLTSSSNPGIAMKVSDMDKAAGAVIGKAMTSLEEGEGYVLVLVNLQ